MNNFIPLNDLDRAVMAMQKSKAAAFPDFCRRLSEGELWVPVQYHPELEDGGGMSLSNGSPVPFAQLDDEKGHTYVPVYSSDARFDESLTKCNVPDNTWLAAAMPAKQLLEILAGLKLWACVNKACATGSMFIGPDLMRDLATGQALKTQPLHTADPEPRQMWIVRAENYPTNLVQAAFEFLCRHRQFRFAFLVTDGSHPTPADKPKYGFAVYMEPEDEVLFHDLSLAIAAGNKDRFDYELSAVEPADIAAFFKAGRPQEGRAQAGWIDQSAAR